MKIIQKKSQLHQQEYQGKSQNKNFEQKDREYKE